MAKVLVKSKKPQYSKSAKQKKEASFPLGKDNIIIIGVGIALIILGYIFMSENSVDGFLPTVVAPILLVLGYCILIPYGILKRPKRVVPSGSKTSHNISVSTSTQTVQANIKTD